MLSRVQQVNAYKSWEQYHPQTTSRPGVWDRKHLGSVVQHVLFPSMLKKPPGLHAKPPAPRPRAPPTTHPPCQPQALAARLRPESLPAYEVLYKSAEELAARREEQRRMAEEARLKVGHGLKV